MEQTRYKERPKSPKDKKYNVRYKRIPKGLDIMSARPDVVNLLIDALNIGMNVTQACHQAGISRETFYEWIRKDPLLADRIDKARTNIERMAKATMYMKLQQESKNVTEDDRAVIENTKWWLERKLKNEYSTRQEFGIPESTEINIKLGTDDDNSE